jgi:GT2 family glycosyltransferase
VRPDVSILVVSWNTRAATLACLDSLPRAVDDGTTYEVVVVDNASRDGSASALLARDDIVFIANDDNLGYAAGVNQAYAASSGEFVLLLNSDAAFRPGGLSGLLRFLREREDVAGVGPLYLNTDGSLQQHHFRLPTFANLLANVSSVIGALPPVARSERRYRMLDVDFSQPIPVEQPSASCLLLRRSALRTDRLLDERYPIYFNDVALAHELATRGEALWMTPDTVVEHEHGASTRQLGRALRRQYLAALVLYLKATESRVRVTAFRGVVLAQGLLSALLRRRAALGLRDLLGAVAGNPGPLPQSPREAVEPR